MRQRTSFKYSVVTALVAGVVLLALTYGSITYGPPGFRNSHIGVTRLVLMYVVGGFIGGTLFWFTQSLMARGHPGRWLVGFLSTAPLGVALGLSLPMSSPGPEIIFGLAWAALLGGGYFMVDR